ncbi:MAG: ATP-dependent 6-phosphofructokinase [Thermaerobacter sp.]|nr:ATP-dependent 6-phosphofructokinase [Thermaerobacter sp.]
MQWAILTSGGDAPGMNAAIRAFVRRGLLDHHTIWGIPRGFEGIARGCRRELQTGSVADIIMTGGTMLHTSRFAEFQDKQVQSQALRQLRDWNLDGLVVLGGNGSLRGAYALSEAGFPTIGIPTSIDNDIYGTDYSIGYDTAMNNIIQSVDKIRDTASAHERIFVVEVMGNQSGALALGAGLAAGAEAVVIPERPPNFEHILERLRSTQARGKKHSFIIVAEGAGRAEQVAAHLAQGTGFEVRWAVLGHTQRGGPPTARDRILGSWLGAEAVTILSQGRSGVMIGVQGERVCITPLSEVVQHERPVDFAAKGLIGMLAH